jgi:hypothetical protein
VFRLFRVLLVLPSGDAGCGDILPHPASFQRGP